MSRTPPTLAIVSTLFLAVIIGCQGTIPSPHDPAGRSVELRRWQDNLGISHNDKRTVGSASAINRLRGFFPEMQTSHTSDLHGPWVPTLELVFVNNDGTQTTITTDYHLYRVDHGERGDFIVQDGLTDEVDRIFAQPPPTPPAP